MHFLFVYNAVPCIFEGLFFSLGISVYNLFIVQPPIINSGVRYFNESGACTSKYFELLKKSAAYLEIVEKSSKKRKI